MPIYKKKSTRKPRKPTVLLIALALLSVFLAIPATAEEAKKGDLAIGAGYATTGTLADYKTVRDSGYSASLEYWTSDRASLLFEGEKLKGGNIYEASYTPKAGVLFVPVGLSYFDPEGLDPEWGAHVGLGINFWAEKAFGLQVSAQYHYLLDQIAGEDQFLGAHGTLRIKF
jgi:hypothetical protein